MRKVIVVTMLTLALALCVTAAGADPWPNYESHTYTVDYVSVVPVFDGATNIWTFQLSVAPGAVDPIYGALDPTYGGVKGFAVYQPDVASPLQPDSHSAGPSGWSYLWESGNDAFGWNTGPSANYIHPGDSASFGGGWVGGAPAMDDFGYLVHVSINSDAGDETFWARPGVIPEPASIVLLGLGGLGLLGLRRRRS